MKKKFFAALFCAGLLVATSTLNADVVDVNKDIMVAPVIVLGANDGGLDFDVNTESANGADALNFRLLVDDSAGSSGATFEAILALSTTDGDGTIFSNVAGRISMGTQVSLLTGALSSFTQTSGTPGATLVFDGFSAVNADQWSLATDTLTIGGASYTGDVNPMPLDLSANLGSTFDASTGANQWRIGDFTARFTAAPLATVPEPGSLALLGLGALGLVARRRR